ncbi:MAG: LytR/AlgR family response regulator transcription factor [Bacteroidia bacterium]
MQRIKTLLVDDETDSREVLLSLLGNYFPEVEVVGEAANVADAYELINAKKPQLVFLDIQMPKSSGFDLLKKFEDVPFEVVFITSFDKYAINAIKFSALDYLLKPVEIEDLSFAIKKAMKSIELKNNSGAQIINLIHSLDTDVKERKIAIHSGEKVKFLSELNIVYVEGDGRYCRVTMLNNEVFTTAKNLKDFEDYFERTNNFVRVTKDFVINIRHIKDYSKGEPCIIEMITGKTFEVARRKKTEVLEKLKK